MRVRDKTRDLFVELMIQFWGSEAESNFLAQDFKGRNDATILCSHTSFLLAPLNPIIRVVLLLSLSSR